MDDWLAEAMKLATIVWIKCCCYMISRCLLAFTLPHRQRPVDAVVDDDMIALYEATEIQVV